MQQDNTHREPPMNLRNIIPPIESEAGFWFVLAVVGWLSAAVLVLAISFAQGCGA